MRSARRRALKMSPRLQRGVIGVVALMFVIVVALFAMTQAAHISASNITDSARQADAVEALFLAESAVERVGYMFVNSSSPPICNDATVGAPSGDINLGTRGAFRVLRTFPTDFDGDALPATMCRVRVQGEIFATRVTRTIDTIVGTTDDIISIASLNPSFNANAYDGSRVDDDDNPPVSWTMTGNPAGTESMSFIAWDQTGGNSDDNLTCRTTGVDCNRAAFARKTDTGPGTASAGGAFNAGTPIEISAPKTLRLSFDFRVWARGGTDQEMYFSPRLAFDTGDVHASGASGGDCASTSAAGWCESGNTSPGQPAWKGTLRDRGCGYVDTPCFESGPADGTCPSYNPETTGYAGVNGTTATGGTNAECVAEGHSPPIGTSGYKSGYLTYVVPCTGTCTNTGKVYLTGINFTRTVGTGDELLGFRAKNGAVTWMWIDNLRLSVPALSGGGPSKVWREVAAP